MQRSGRKSKNHCFLRILVGGTPLVCDHILFSSHLLHTLMYPALHPQMTDSFHLQGIIMSLHLYKHHSAPGGLRLLSAYENGSVVLRAYTRTDKPVSIEGEGWDVLWTSKLHVESGMFTDFSPLPLPLPLRLLFHMLSWLLFSIDGRLLVVSHGYAGIPRKRFCCDSVCRPHRWEV
jgi:hypothetical protein